MKKKEQNREVPRLAGRPDRLFDGLKIVIAHHARDRVPITHECWRNVVDALTDLRKASGNPPNLHRLADQLIPLGVEGWIASFDDNRAFPLHHAGHPLRAWFLELLEFLNARDLVTSEIRHNAARALLDAFDRIHFDVQDVRLAWTAELQHVLKPILTIVSNSSEPTVP